MKNNINRRDFVRITAVGAGVLALGGFGIKELIESGSAREFAETRPLLGTFITIKLIETEAERANGAIEDAFAEIQRLSLILSRHDPASELSILNKTGAIANASPELVGVIQKARAFSELSSGAFDVSVLPLLKLYSQSFAEGGSPPAERDIEATRAAVDYRLIETKDRSITLAAPGMGLTLDGIAKGYVVDQAAALLKARGLTQVMVEAGGDMSLRGMREDGQAWKIGLTHPRALAGYYEVIQTSNDCLATSGDYENAFTADYSWHHIIDPRVGHSPREVASATVIAADTAYADALATAAMVMGVSESLALFETLPGVQALLIDKGMKRHATSNFGAVVG
ncbi:MAG: FAD:protein FMN transferase [Dehalogenimonas sp.]|uniref:FAD:protein FMN transferase n=1 Tax=Candidatus Dehalogenimonas loeffleri TaxID=3127115 RepID=A0ABZ2J9Y2_9CHLR|nr:FAD:protein FMN transferase [Dehalogenimonas sp.]